MVTFQLLNHKQDFPQSFTSASLYILNKQKFNSEIYLAKSSCLKNQGQYKYSEKRSYENTCWVSILVMGKSQGNKDKTAFSLSSVKM